MNSLDLLQVVFMLKKGFKWIIASIIIFTVVVGVISTFVLPEKYTSNVSLYVTSINNQETTTLTTLNTAQEMVTTYIKILTNKVVLEEVVNELDSKVTVGQLRSALSINADGNTEILIISASTKDPQLSADICNAMATVAPAVFESIFESGAVKKIDTATASSSPSSPNVKRNVVLGALVGAIISCAIIIIVYMVDNTVKDEQDFKSRIDIPVLGEIPSFKKSKKNRRRRHD